MNPIYRTSISQPKQSFQKSLFLFRFCKTYFCAKTGVAVQAHWLFVPVVNFTMDYPTVNRTFFSCRMVTFFIPRFFFHLEDLLLPFECCDNNYQGFFARELCPTIFPLLFQRNSLPSGTLRLQQ